MKHGSLFSGIGGFDLAASWMNWQNVFHCEYNTFCQQILKYYWPNAESYSDITKSDFTKYANSIDILTGGFPCQPYSQAGKRRGKEDERHLWPSMLRAIREIRPRWILGENVYGIITWSKGLVFHEIQTDLEVEGYEVFPYVLPACSVNAPHRRDRVWFVAHSNRNGFHRLNCENEKHTGKSGINALSNTFQSINDGIVTDAGGVGQQGQRRTGNEICKETFRDWKASWFNNDGTWPTQSPICNGNDGFSSRLDTTTISKKDWIENSLSAGGNAIVPQVALQIFKAIEEYESITSIPNRRNR